MISDKILQIKLCQLTSRAHGGRWRRDSDEPMVSFCVSLHAHRRSTAVPRAQKPESFKFCFSTMSKTASKTTFAFFESVAVVS